MERRASNHKAEITGDFSAEKKKMPTQERIKLLHHPDFQVVVKNSFSMVRSRVLFSLSHACLSKE